MAGIIFKKNPYEGLSTRASNVLRNRDWTLDDVQRLIDRGESFKIIKTRGCGRQTFDEIIRWANSKIVDTKQLINPSQITCPHCSEAIKLIAMMGEI